MGDDQHDRQYRTILHFDTSSLPDNAVITKVLLQFREHLITGEDPFLTHLKLITDINDGAFSNNNALVSSDFQDTSSSDWVGFFRPVPANPIYYRTRLRSDAHQYINLDGVTQFRMRFAYDDDDDNTVDLLKFYCGDRLILHHLPMLRVWYYVP